MGGTKNPEIKGSKERKILVAELPASEEARRQWEALEKQTAPSTVAERLSDMVDVTPESVKQARKLLAQADAWIKLNVYQEVKDRYHLGVHPPDWYLPIMLKESRLKPGTPGGYFQLGKFALGDVREKMRVDVDPTRPFHDVIGGILYYHMCRFDAVEKPVFRGVSEHDKDLLSYAIYNAGSSTIQKLWAHLQPKDFSDFVKKLSKIVSGSDEAAIKMDPSYHTMYEETAVITRYLNQNLSNPKREISIGGAKLRREKVPIFLRYALLIDSLRNKMDEGENIVDSRPYIDHSEKFDPQTDSIWKAAKGLAQKLHDTPEAQTPFLQRFFNEHDIRESDTIEFFANAIILLNRKFNPQLKDVDDDASNIPEDTTLLYSPTAKYLEEYYQNLDEEERQFAEERERLLPSRKEVEKTPGGVYADKNLEAQGRVILKSEGKPAMKVDGELYRPKAKNLPHYLVLHSTESESSNFTREKHRAHFAVDRNGTVWQVVDPERSVDHVGDIDNRHAKALWNGEEYLSRKSIGIEVVASVDKPQWTEAQYRSVRKLLHFYGDVYKIPVSNVLTHQQVACGLSRSGNLFRGRKGDPFFVDWGKLGLPNNYQLLDREVIAGRVASNLAIIESGRTGKGHYDVDAWNGKPACTLDGLKVSVGLKTKTASKSKAQKTRRKSARKK